MANILFKLALSQIHTHTHYTCSHTHMYITRTCTSHTRTHTHTHTHTLHVFTCTSHTHTHVHTTTDMYIWLYVLCMLTLFSTQFGKWWAPILVVTCLGPVFALLFSIVGCCFCCCRLCGKCGGDLQQEHLENNDLKCFILYIMLVLCVCLLL